MIGGSAAPPAVIEAFEQRHGIHVTHAWGMTETNPLGTVAHVKPALAGGSHAERLAARASQGLPVPLVEARHVDDAGGVLPRDGAAMGELAGARRLGRPRRTSATKARTAGPRTVGSRRATS